MLKRLIKTIRKQPKARRDTIAMGIAGTFTAFVFMVWLYNVPEKMSNLAEEKEADSLPSFSHLFSEVKNQASAVKATFTGEEELATTTTEQLPYGQNEETNTGAYMATSSSSPTTTANARATSTLYNSIVDTPGPASTSPSKREVRIVTTPPASSTSSSTAEVE